MTNLGRYENTQRVERADMELIGDTIPRNMGAALPSQFLTNPAGQAAWIMSGFAVSNPALKQCRVDRGVALLQTKESGTVERGMLAYEGSAFINLDLAAYANGTYSVYIRFELVDGDFQNRIFWTGAAEAPSNIATKRVAGWNMRVELVSPGSEWFKIGEVVVSGSPTLTVTNKRFFYFEGEEANATPYAKSWGGGSDRNSNRAVNGVKDLQTFVQAVQVQLESIMGTPQRWWETPTVALNQKVSKAGDTMTDTLLIQKSNTAASTMLGESTSPRVRVDNSGAGTNAKAGAHFSLSNQTDEVGGVWIWRRSATDIALAIDINDAALNSEPFLMATAVGATNKRFRVGNDAALAAYFAIRTKFEVMGRPNGANSQWDDCGILIENPDITANCEVILAFSNTASNGLGSGNMWLNGMKHDSPHLGWWVDLADGATILSTSRYMSLLANTADPQDPSTSFGLEVRAGRDAVQPTSERELAGIVQNKGIMARVRVSWSAGTPSLSTTGNNNYNVTAAPTDNGVGDVSILYNVPVSSPHMVLATPIDNNRYYATISATGIATTGCRVLISDAAGAAVDPTGVHIVVFGKPNVAP